MLRAHRQRRCLSQVQLAKLAGVSQAHVARLEGRGGKVPSLSILNALAAALSLTAEERAELILHFADRQGAAVAPEVGTADTEQMLPVNGDEVEAA
jgi:transcriptional regulator with XRE-family HTH domain